MDLRAWILALCCWAVCLPASAQPCLAFTRGPQAQAEDETLSAVGVASGVYNEADGRKRGYLEAMRGIALQLRALVRSATTVHKWQLGSSRGTDVQDDVSIATQLEVVGGVLNDTCYDQDRGTFYVRVLLSRAAARRVLTEKLEGLRADATRDCSSLRDALASRDLLRAVRRAATLRKVLSQARSQLGLLQAVGGHFDADIACADSSELAQLRHDLRISVQVRDPDGTVVAHLREALSRGGVALAMDNDRGCPLVLRGTVATTRADISTDMNMWITNLRAELALVDVRAGTTVFSISRDTSAGGSTRSASLQRAGAALAPEVVNEVGRQLTVLLTGEP